VISVAQLHGTEDEEYIARLKEASASGNGTPIPVIKCVRTGKSEKMPSGTEADYYLFDSGAGSGKTFDWDRLDPEKIDKP